MQAALRRLAPLLAVALATLAPLASAASGEGEELGQIVRQAQRAAMQAQEDPGAAAEEVTENPEGVLDDLVNPPEETDGDAAPPREDRDVGFADSIRDAFQGRMVVASAVGFVATALGLGGFAFVTRYVSPKEALKNPQRAMLYGFVRGNPGVHLKRLSEEFAMKTSSILWHIRKLENAELVHSERANGFRVFYPTEGGIEVKRVSRAITALQNRNARALFEAIEAKPGTSPADLSERLRIHAGTVRWHLRKLRDFGLVEELLRNEGSLVYPTPLGIRSLHTLAGAPVEPSSRPAANTLIPSPMPNPVE